MLEEIEYRAICSYEEGHRYFSCSSNVFFNLFFNIGICACGELESSRSSREGSTVGHQLLGVYSTRARNVPSTVWVGSLEFDLFYAN
jgi:hypothetical protein